MDKYNTISLLNSENRIEKLTSVQITESLFQKKWQFL